MAEKKEPAKKEEPKGPSAEDRLKALEAVVFDGQTPEAIDVRKK